MASLIQASCMVAVFEPLTRSAGNVPGPGDSDKGGGSKGVGPDL